MRRGNFRRRWRWWRCRWRRWRRIRGWWRWLAQRHRHRPAFRLRVHRTLVVQAVARTAVAVQECASVDRGRLVGTAKVEVDVRVDTPPGVPAAACVRAHVARTLWRHALVHVARWKWTRRGQRREERWRRRRRDVDDERSIAGADAVLDGASNQLCA